jgi:FkbM family methyltransferase
MFVNSTGGNADIDMERDEKMLVRKHLPRNAIVLELGARYGTVSCAISEVLDDPMRHVAVEPDGSVIEALKKNRDANGGKFHIYNGVVSNKNYKIKYRECCEYSTCTEESSDPGLNTLSLEKLQEKYNLTFNCIVADCEGFFPKFIKEYPWILEQCNCIIYEKDGVPYDILGYEELDKTLLQKGFKMVECIPHTKWKNNPTYHSAWLK